MAGIYIHIPFCRQACHYCNFHFVTSLKNKSELISALIKELELRKDYLQGDIIETIYIGGGTPSLCSQEEIKSLARSVHSHFSVAHGMEITLEANPDDISEEKLNGWKEAGINRLSIGVQSFFEEDLRWMNRAHNAEQALDSLLSAKKYFDNITIDLIYGTPQMTNDKWKENVETALSLHIPHLSCYALTVEPKTPLEKMIRLHRSEDVNPDKQSEQFLLLMEWMEKAGYEHYEISNYAKTGCRSRHNSSYWQGKKYLGIGPASHSFNGTERQWNKANNTIYIESIDSGIVPYEKEELTPVQRINEYIMTSLRTAEGLNLELIDNNTRVQLLSAADRYINSGLLVLLNNSLILTKEGKLLADGIAAALFV